MASTNKEYKEEETLRKKEKGRTSEGRMGSGNAHNKAGVISGRKSGSELKHGEVIRKKEGGSEESDDEETRCDEKEI